MTADLLVRTVPRRATNISLPIDLCEEAKALGINLSQTVERMLRQAIRDARDQAWEREHAGFVEAYNQTIAAEGTPLAAWRSF